MRKIMLVLTIFAVVAVFAGCGKTETVVPETTIAVTAETSTPTETEILETTEVPTEAPTEPEAYEGVLKYYFKEFYDLASNPCTLEIVENKAIRVNLHQKVMYRKEFVEQIAVGDTLVLHDGEIVIEKIDRWGDEHSGFIYEINTGLQDCVRLVQEVSGAGINPALGDYCLTDTEFWPIYAYVKSVDLTPQSGPLSFFDHATDDMELRDKEQSFLSLYMALKNGELEHSTIKNTRVSLGDEFLYTTIYVQNDGE